MADRADRAKRDALFRRGALHPHPERVTDPLFQDEPFFDARDAVQVKYEMLRSVRADRRRVTEAAAQFGFSRPTFYEARAAFERAGMPGLLPAKKGPRGGHKLSDAVLSFVEEQLGSRPSATPAELTERIRERFGVKVHPRSVRRALVRRSKKKPVAAPTAPRGLAARYERLREQALHGGGCSSVGMMLVRRQGLWARMLLAASDDERDCALAHVSEPAPTPLALPATVGGELLAAWTDLLVGVVRRQEAF
jgi:transposase